jgi:hypothetical protein
MKINLNQINLVNTKQLKLDNFECENLKNVKNYTFLRFLEDKSFD